MSRQGKIKRGTIAYFGDRQSLGHRAAVGYSSRLSALNNAAPQPGWTPPAPANQASVEQAISAVMSKRAGAAVVPFFSSSSGYDAAAVSAITRSFGVQISDEVVEEGRYCLAVPREHVMQREMSSFTGGERANGYVPGRNSAISAADQHRLKSQITEVFASPSAEQACSFELSNFASRGAKIRAIESDASAVRTFLSTSTGALDDERVVRSLYNSQTNGFDIETMFTGKARNMPIYGVVLPFEEANANEDLIVVDAELENAQAEFVRYAVLTRRSSPYVEGVKKGGWPFGVRSWDGGRAAGLFGNAGPIDLSGWYRTPWRQFHGSAIIANTLRHDFKKPRHRRVRGERGHFQTLRLILAEYGGGGKAPAFDAVLRNLRKLEHRYETGAVRTGDSSPVNIIEAEIDFERRAALKSLIKRIRAGEHSMMILGGFYSDENRLEHAGRGRTIEEKIDRALSV